VSSEHELCHYPGETDFRAHVSATPAVVENIIIYNLAFQLGLASTAKHRNTEIFHANFSFIYHD
jgi:hypothetical protein